MEGIREQQTLRIRDNEERWLMERGEVGGPQVMVIWKSEGGESEREVRIGYFI